MMKISSIGLLLLSAASKVARAEDALTVVVGETNMVDACVADFDAGSDVDYFPIKYTKPTIESYGDVDINGEIFVPHNTTDFLSIDYYKTYKIVTNKHQDPPKKYLLYQCGTDVPELEEEFDLVVPVPHKGGLALTQTPMIPYVELLGLRTEVIAYIGNPIYVTSPCMKHMLGENATEGRGTSITTIYDRNSTIQESLIADFREEHPTALIVSGPTNNVVGDQVIVSSATQERTNVATFDWISFYAAFYNMESESNRIRAEYQDSYDCSSEVAQAIVAEQREQRRQLEGHTSTSASDMPAVPKVLWANYFTYQDLGWSVAECPTWDNAYYCEYATHCGAQVISRPEGVGYNRTWGSPTVYWYLSNEEFLEMGKDADVFIYTGADWAGIYEKLNTTLDQIKAVQDGLVYDTLGQGASAWNEQRYAEYDIVGLDMCDVVGHSPESHERRWFRNVFTEEIGSLGECDVAGGEINEPYVPPPQQQDCVRPSDTDMDDEKEEEEVSASKTGDEEAADEEAAAAAADGSASAAVSSTTTTMMMMRSALVLLVGVFGILLLA